MEVQKVEGKNLSSPLRTKSIVTNDFKIILQTVAFDIGIRQALTLEDLDSIFNFLKKNFGATTLQDITDAFDLYSAQKLDFKDGHFNSFDKVFVGKVLKSYNDKKDKDRVKPKQFEPQKKIVWGWNEKKDHFNWLLNEVFLTDTENSDFGEFPNIVIASFKDIFDYMETEGMIVKMEGQQLKTRLKQIETMVNSGIKNNNKKVSYDALINTNKGDLPPSYYRYEVMDYFIKNRIELMNKQLWD